MMENHPVAINVSLDIHMIDQTSSFMTHDIEWDTGCFRLCKGLNLLIDHGWWCLSDVRSLDKNEFKTRLLSLWRCLACSYLVCSSSSVLYDVHVCRYEVTETWLNKPFQKVHPSQGPLWCLSGLSMCESSHSRNGNQESSVDLNPTLLGTRLLLFVSWRPV